MGAPSGAGGSSDTGPQGQSGGRVCVEGLHHLARPDIHFRQVGRQAGPHRALRRAGYPIMMSRQKTGTDAYPENAARGLGNIAARCLLLSLVIITDVLDRQVIKATVDSNVQDRVGTELPSSCCYCGLEMIVTEQFGRRLSAELVHRNIVEDHSCVLRTAS